MPCPWISARIVLEVGKSALITGGGHPARPGRAWWCRMVRASSIMTTTGHWRSSCFAGFSCEMDVGMRSLIGQAFARN